MELVRIHPTEMTEGEKRELVRFSKWDVNQGRSASDLVRFVLQDLYQMWRIGGAEGTAGILLTRVIRTEKGGRTLYIEALVGRGLVKNANALGEAVRGLAVEGRCGSVTGWVSRPGMVKMVRIARFPIVAQVFSSKVGGKAHAG